MVPISLLSRRTVTRARDVLTAHPWIVDGLLWALPVTWVGVRSVLSEVGMESTSTTPPWMHVAVAVLMTAPLVLRRAHPLLSSVLIAVGCGLSLLVGMGPSLSVIAVPLTVFSTAKWGTRTDSRIVLVLGLIGALAMGLWAYTIALQATMSPGGQPIDGSEYSALLALVVLCAAIVLSSWLMGVLGHRRRAAVEDIRERNRLLEKERESESRLAADAERMRIAREMHDIIAHSLSVVIAQADGGRYAAKSDPDAAAEALATIAQTGRDALAQTRNLLGVLRADTSGGETTSPLPGLLDVPALVKDVRAAGMSVDVDGFDSPSGAGSTTADSASPASSLTRRLPEGAGLAVYRIVQEALTNVLKHAGSGARAQVGLTSSDRDLIVRIRDDGGPDAERTAEGPRGEGRGILGMRERATLYGGTLEAGPPPGAERGFTVTARFPLAAPLGSAPRSPGSEPVSPSTPEAAHAPAGNSPAGDSSTTPETAAAPARNSPAEAAPTTPEESTP